MLALRGMRVHDILALAAPVLLLWVAGPGPAAAHSSAQVASTPPAPVAAAAAASGLPPEAVLAAVRQATATYLDIEKARADGYVQISGMETNHGVHFLNVNAQMLSAARREQAGGRREDRKSTRLNSSHTVISYAVFCLKKKKQKKHTQEITYNKNIKQI